MRHYFCRLALLLGLCTAFAQAQTYAIHGMTDKEVAIYDVGEAVIFTLKVKYGKKPVAGMTIRWKRTGDDGETAKGEGVAGIDGLTVASKMDQAGFIRLQAWAFDPEGKPLQGFKGGWGGSKQGNIFFDGGACVDPQNIEPAAEPDEFETFWDGVRKELATVPLKAQLKELSREGDKVKVYAVTLDCAGPKPVTGYLSVPANAKAKSLKAICKFHGYGVRKHNPPGHPNKHAIVFDVNAHGMELGREDAYYEQLKTDLKGYCFDKQENQKPETSYYYGMAMRVLQALEYVKTLPEWNGRDLASNGGSQGGLQALWGAGLDQDVTSTNTWSPWCCDLGGITMGRLKGWRPDYTEALALFDPVFHASRIKGKVHLIANYGDYTCPPSSVWLVYNQIPHPQKSMEVKQGCTHSYQMKQHASFVMSPDGIRDVKTK